MNIQVSDNITINKKNKTFMLIRDDKCIKSMKSNSVENDIMYVLMLARATPFTCELHCSKLGEANITFNSKKNNRKVDFSKTLIFKRDPSLGFADFSFFTQNGERVQIAGAGKKDPLLPTTIKNICSLFGLKAEIINNFSDNYKIKAI